VAARLEQRMEEGSKRKRFSTGDSSSDSLVCVVGSDSFCLILPNLCLRNFEFHYILMFIARLSLSHQSEFSRYEYFTYTLRLKIDVSLLSNTDVLRYILIRDKFISR
jgi:hypothetical protein